MFYLDPRAKFSGHTDDGLAVFKVSDQDLEDRVTEIIDDSMGPDWTPRDAAKHLIENGLVDAEPLVEANCILEDALQEAGDDYPGSSMQEWCRQQVKKARQVANRMK